MADPSPGAAERAAERAEFLRARFEEANRRTMETLPISTVLQIEAIAASTPPQSPRARADPVDRHHAAREVYTGPTTGSIPTGLGGRTGRVPMPSGGFRYTAPKPADQTHRDRRVPTINAHPPRATPPARESRGAHQGSRGKARGASRRPAERAVEAGFREAIQRAEGEAIAYRELRQQQRERPAPPPDGPPPPDAPAEVAPAAAAAPPAEPEGPIGQRRVIRVSYHLPDRVVVALKRTFPGYRFVWPADGLAHSHPYAATERRIVEEMVVETVTAHVRARGYADLELFDLGPDGAYVDNPDVNHLGRPAIVDIGGNAQRHSQAGRRNIHSCCPLIDDRDAFRTDRYDAVRDRFCTCYAQSCNCVAPIAHISIDSLYYLTPDDVVACMQRSMTGEFVAAIHPYPDAAGWLYDGEMTYSSSAMDQATVELTRRPRNVSVEVKGNGRAYTHDALDWLRQWSHIDLPLGMRLTWDLQRVVGNFEIYRFRFGAQTAPRDVSPIPVSVTQLMRYNSLAAGNRMFVPFHAVLAGTESENVPDVERYSADESRAVCMFGIIMAYRPHASVVYIPKQLIPTMATRCAGKPRTFELSRRVDEWVRRALEEIHWPTDMIAASTPYITHMAMAYTLEAELTANDAIARPIKANYARHRRMQAGPLGESSGGLLWYAWAAIWAPTRGLRMPRVVRGTHPYLAVFLAWLLVFQGVPAALRRMQYLATTRDVVAVALAPTIEETIKHLDPIAANVLIFSELLFNLASGLGLRALGPFYMHYVALALPLPYAILLHTAWNAFAIGMEMWQRPSPFAQLPTEPATSQAPRGWFDVTVKVFRNRPPVANPVAQNDVCFGTLDAPHPEMRPIREGCKVRASHSPCAPKLACFLNFVGLAALRPVVPRSCSHNEELAVRNRSTFPLTEEADAWHEILVFVAAYKDVLGLHTRVDATLFEIWVARFTPAHRKLLQAAHDNPVPYTKSERRVKAFVKRELLLKAGPDGEVDVSPRLIQGVGDTYLSLVGPWVHAFGEHLKGAWNATGWLHYSSGSTPESLGAWFDDAESELGPDCAGFEADANRFDGSQGEGAKNLETQVDIYAGAPTCVVSAKIDQHRMRGTTAHGIVFYAPWCMKSGVPNTSTGNSVQTGVSWAKAVDTVLRQHGYTINDAARFIRIIVLGDDNFAVARPWLARGLHAIGKSYMARLGYTVDTAYHANPRNGTFCSGRFYPTQAGSVWGPKIGRALPKMFVELASDNQDHVGWTQQVASAYNRAYSHVPILRAAAKRAVELTLDVVPTPAAVRAAAATLKEKTLTKQAHRASDAIWGMMDSIYGLTREAIEDAEEYITHLPLRPAALSGAIYDRLVETDEPLDKPQRPHAVVSGCLSAAVENFLMSNAKKRGTPPANHQVGGPLPTSQPGPANTANGLPPPAFSAGARRRPANGTNISSAIRKSFEQLNRQRPAGGKKTQKSGSASRGVMASHTEAQATEAAVLAMFTMPRENQPIRFSSEFTDAPTAVAHPTYISDAVWEPVNTNHQLVASDMYAALFRDPLRAAIQYDANPAGLASQYTYTLEDGNQGGTTTDFYVPQCTGAGSPFTPLRILYGAATSGYQQHGPIRHIGRVEGAGSYLYHDGNAASQEAYSLVTTGVTISTTGHVYALFAEAEYPDPGQPAANDARWIDLGAWTGNSQTYTFFGPTAPGYYQLWIDNKKDADLLVGYNSANVGSSFRHLSLPGIETNSGSIRGVRILAGDMLYSNTAADQSISGAAAIVQVGAEEDWTVGVQNGAGYPTVSSIAGADVRTIKLGRHGFLKPSDASDFDFFNPYVNGLPVGYEVRPAHAFLQFYSTINLAGGRAGFFSMGWAIEYETDDYWRDLAVPSVPEPLFRAALCALRAIPQFNENPTHWANILRAIAKTLGIVGTLGSPVFNAILPGSGVAAAGIGAALTGLSKLGVTEEVIPSVYKRHGY